MVQPLTTSRPFFDRVLGEYEAGHVGEAVLMLAGMLDTALERGEALAGLRRAFTEHPLGTLCRAAAEPGNRLGAAVARLGFARGLATRRELGGKAIGRAWQSGQRILLVDCGEHGELAALRGLSLDNVALQHADPVAAAKLARRFGLTPPAANQHFDLILANTLADQCDHTALTDRMTGLASRLAPQGSLLLSAFVPRHLGWGWQAVCMGRDLHCHDETDLAASAAQAGFEITQFRDGSNSLIWAELQKSGAQDPARGQS